MDKNNNISAFDEIFKSQLQEHSIQAPLGVLKAVQAANVSAVAKVVTIKWIIGSVAVIGMGTGILLSQNQKTTPTDSKITLTTESVKETNIPTLPNIETGLMKKEAASTATAELFNKVSAKSEIKKQEKKITAIEHKPATLLTGIIIPEGAPILNKNAAIPPKPVVLGKTVIENVNTNIKIEGNACSMQPVRLYLKQNIVANWFINGVKQTKTDHSMDALFTKKILYKIEAYQGDYKIADTTLDFTKPSVTVYQTKLAEGVKELVAGGINQSNTMQWVYNNEVISYQKACVFNTIIHEGMPLLVVTNNMGCADTITYQTEEKGRFKILTQIITPDGDGKNDAYELEIEGYLFFNIAITDVNGKLVFIETNPNNTWKGINKFTNQPCPKGMYIATISYQLKGKINKEQVYEKVWLNK